MKKVIILLLTLGIAGIARAQFDGPIEPILTRSLSSEMINKVIASTSGGNITVTGINSGEPKLEVYARQNGKNLTSSKEDNQKLLNENYELNIAIINNELHATAKPKKSLFKSSNTISLSFKIFVPQNISTNLEASGGNIGISDLIGDEKLSTSGGNLRIQNLRGTINADASGGNIDAKNSSGNISFSVSGGTLNVDGLKGIIKASTSGGNIRGNNIEGNLTVQASGGNISLQDMVCSLNVSNSGGNMNVSAKELGKYITLQNSGGNIDLLLPSAKGVTLKLQASKIKWNTLNIDNFTGSKKEDRVIGTLSGGGIPITAETSDKITLAFK